MKYENILIVYKQANSEALALGQAVMAWLKGKGVNCGLYESPVLLSGEKKPPDMAVVIGGDGTLIGLARNLAPERIPIYAINLGNLGFLTSTEKDGWQNNLERALEGDMPVRERAILKWAVCPGAGKAVKGWAVNETVIARGALARLINLEISINKSHMGLLRCDGVIVCTPAGSSAYAVSAGGPLIHPDLAVSCLVPICPFPASVSPLVMPASAVYEFKIADAAQDCELTIDGQEGMKLARGDIIKVKSRPSSLFIFGDEDGYFDKLGKRGFSLIK